MSQNRIHDLNSGGILASYSVVQWLAICLVIVLFARLLLVGRREGALPPGPPTLPILGNLHQTSRGDLHVLLTEWSRRYGGIISLKNGNHTTVVLTDRVAIKQLLDRRGGNYADRPDSYVLNELVTGGHHLLPMRYGERWRKLRRVLTQELSEARCDQKHLPLQDAEAVQMLADFIDKPAEYKAHPKRFSTSIMTSTVFGVRMPNADVQFMKDLDKMFFELVSNTVTGACPPVDSVPMLKYLPDFMWKNWRSNAVNVGKKLRSFYGDLIQRVKTRREAKGSCNSFLDHVIEQQDKYSVTDKELVFLCGTLLEGGSDTSSATMQVFLEAMFTHPEVQRRAQREIDAMFDESRMPTWNDYDSLPYISQIIKETIRWKPISPTAFPHATTTEDTYEGYLIPSRATIIINVYGLHRDPKYFPEPDEFRPERFEGLTAPASQLANAADPTKGRDHYGYGAGRRICPGIHLAERNLFIGVAKLLWAFQFERLDDGEIDVTKGELKGPNDMRCRITLRSERRRRTILKELQRIKAEVFSQYEAEV